MARRKIGSPVAFEGAAAGPAPPPPSGGPVLAYAHRDTAGRTWVYNLAGFPVAAISADLARIFAPKMEREFAGLAVPSVVSHRKAWLAFCHLLAGTGREIAGLRSIEASDIDAFDTPRNYNNLVRVIGTLRRIDEIAPGTLPMATKMRLRFYSNRPAKEDSTPRDAFSEHVAGQILARVDPMIAAARDRIRAGRALADELRRDPAPRWFDEVYLRCVDGGRVAKSEWDRNVGDVWARAHGCEWPEASPAATVCIRGDTDAFAFLYAIGLRVEMPVECLKGLRRDCLKNASGGLVDIEYLKRRGGTDSGGQGALEASGARHVTKTERVRDGGITTPGGIIRLLLELTGRAADLLRAQGNPDADMLWVGYNSRRSPAIRRFAFNDGTAGSFAQLIGAVEGDGSVARALHPSRMRKTVKSERYKEFGGHLGRFASDNSRSVAARNYADIPAHRDLHEQAVEDAATQLHNVATQPPAVLAPDDEARAREEGLQAAGSHVPPDKIAEILGGMHDLWLSSCADFWASPFGKTRDGGCASPFDDCVHCRNAIFTARKLPGLLGYLGWVEDRRSILTEAAWTEAHSASYVRITEQILPRFDSAAVEAARKHLAEHGRAFYIPLPERVA